MTSCSYAGSLYWMTSYSRVYLGSDICLAMDTYTYMHIRNCHLPKNFVLNSLTAQFHTYYNNRVTTKTDIWNSQRKMATGTIHKSMIRREFCFHNIVLTSRENHESYGSNYLWEGFAETLRTLMNEGHFVFIRCTVPTTSGSTAASYRAPCFHRSKSANQDLALKAH